MIRSKPKFDGLAGPELIAARLDDLDRRLYEWELAQAATWAWNASAKGDELSAKVSVLQETVDRLAGYLAGMNDVVLDERRLKTLEAENASLRDQLREMDRFRSNALELIEAIAVTAGYQKWDDSLTDWDTWFQHVTGKKPA
jgi:hypothetical protein